MSLLLQLIEIVGLQMSVEDWLVMTIFDDTRRRLAMLLMGLMSLFQDSQSENEDFFGSNFCVHFDRMKFKF